MRPRGARDQAPSGPGRGGAARGVEGARAHRFVRKQAIAAANAANFVLDPALIFGVALGGVQARTPTPPLVLSGHAASLTPY